MTNRRSKYRARAIFAFDLIAGVGLMMLILAGFGIAANRLASIQKLTAMQRQVRDAAELALNCVRAGAGDPQEVVRKSGTTYANEIEIRVTRESGTGDWDGATRISVEARLDRGEQSPIRVILAGYVYGREGK